mmetsp:Transcript_35378/g.102150  ORF Transcript_35378/g.102150 Transcript_35378/m.102150 type:complete len:116 (-) Transcript_35378:256-603(-)
MFRGAAAAIALAFSLSGVAAAEDSRFKVDLYEQGAPGADLAERPERRLTDDENSTDDGDDNMTTTEDENMTSISDEVGGTETTTLTARPAGGATSWRADAVLIAFGATLVSQSLA